MSILKQGKSYTFSDYFELNYPTEDILAELGYQYQVTKLSLPHISLTSETAKREVMVAPILLELLDEMDLKIEIEYPVYVSEYLKGNLDYWVRSSHGFVVVEAKKADMEKGFTQLAVELIAMDQYLDTSNPMLYGAITIGDLWRFGQLERQEKRILRDIDSFRVPLDLEELFRIFLGILNVSPSV